MQFYLLPDISNILGYILKEKHKILLANFHFFAKIFKANIYSYPVKKKERKNIYFSIFTPSPQTNPVAPLVPDPLLEIWSLAN